MKYIYSTISFFVFSLLIAGSANTASALEYQGRVLKLGTKGDDVKALQECLVPMGFSFDSGIDGYFGQETHSAIVKFQQTKGLEGDGVVGPYTSRLLDCKKSSMTVTQNTSAMVATSVAGATNDTALFNFKLNLSPFKKSIYVPANARAAARVLVVTPSGDSVEVPQKLAMSSSAPIVTGVDGNPYYQVAKPEIFTITSNTKPGRGSYRGQLAQVSFTSQDVLGKDYTGFMGVSLPLDHKQWTTKTVDVEN
jgi:peptidoglycan hydrolase-like protein with peptidoglycan-binding domain